MPEQARASIKRGDLAGEYFEQLRGRFELAADAAGGAVAQDLEVAGLRLRLRCAGESMRAALLPPFEHLAADGPGIPELTISLFDTASTAVEAPPPAWDPLPAAPGTNPVARLRSERFSLLAAAGTGALTAIEPAAGVGFFHLPDAERIPPSERAAPLPDALQLLMAERGRWMTHAGAVGRDGRGVLLVGRGGSGKSTLALSCALAGMEIAADDYVLLEPGDPPAVHAMQSTAKLTEDSAARLGLGAEAIDAAGFEPTLEGPAKALVEIRALAPGAMVRRLEIGAVVAPDLPPLTSPFVSHIETKDEVSPGDGGYEPVLRSTSAAQGLRAVAPSTIVQSGFQGASSLAALAGLVRRVPSYALELSPDPVANAAAVGRLVDQLG
ncbi:MAG TPA: hypothetical protein VGN84_05485 [Solirubrobacterales bacterium]|nr:hypothetical protein [Solirubrobacterales bacterium]